jgi:GT2 family glycosyltransferase
MNKKISAILVTYGNRFNFLELTINALLKDDKISNIIIFDNNSDNQSKKNINKLENNNKISVINSNENL